MPASPEDIAFDVLEGLKPDDPIDPRNRAEEALLSLLRSYGDLNVVMAYEDARQRCGW